MKRCWTCGGLGCVPTLAIESRAGRRYRRFLATPAIDFSIATASATTVTALTHALCHHCEVTFSEAGSRGTSGQASVYIIILGKETRLPSGTFN